MVKGDTGLGDLKPNKWHFSEHSSATFLIKLQGERTSCFSEQKGPQPFPENEQRFKVAKKNGK